MQNRPLTAFAVYDQNIAAKWLTDNIDVTNCHEYNIQYQHIV